MFLISEVYSSVYYWPRQCVHQYFRNIFKHILCLLWGLSWKTEIYRTEDLRPRYLGRRIKDRVHIASADGWVWVKPGLWHPKYPKITRIHNGPTEPFLFHPLIHNQLLSLRCCLHSTEPFGKYFPLKLI